ncbi:MAG: hypothetical protein KBT19_10090 [Lachnospiraceae bacterium]|nr:hypothetical protein [Candidatus Colinaster equi]
MKYRKNVYKLIASIISFALIISSANVYAYEYVHNSNEIVYDDVVFETSSDDIEATSFEDNESLTETEETETEVFVECTETEDISDEELTEVTTETEAETEDMPLIGVTGIRGVDMSKLVIQAGGLETADVVTTGMDAVSTCGISKEVSKEYVDCEDIAGATEAVYNAYMNRDSSVDLSPYHIIYVGNGDSDEHIGAIIADVINSNPKFFYIEPYFNIEYKDGYVTLVELEYNDMYPVEVSSDYETALREAYNEAIPDNSVNAETKALLLHDWMCTHVEYDLSYSRYDAYNAIVERKAVCQGYTLAYDDLLSMAGISHDHALSHSMNHIWNYVNIGGSWYHVDTTWDDPINDVLGRCMHSHFLRTDSAMQNKLKHYGWINLHSCNNSKYDNYWWTDLMAAIYYLNSTYYYVCNDGFVKRSGQTVTPIMDESQGYFWLFYCRTAYDGKDIIFFNCRSNDWKYTIYAYSISNKTLSLIYEGGNVIYGLRYIDGKLQVEFIDGKRVFINMPYCKLVGYKTTYTYNGYPIPKIDKHKNFDHNLGDLYISWYADKAHADLLGGESYSPTDAGTYYLNIKSSKFDYFSQDFVITIKKAKPKVDPPKDMGSIKYYTGLKVSVFNLPTVTESPLTPGVWNWKNPDDLINTLGKKNYKAVFIPDDSKNYETVETDVAITLLKATIYCTDKPSATGINYGQSLLNSTVSGNLRFNSATGPKVTTGFIRFEDSKYIPTIEDSINNIDYKVIYTPTAEEKQFIEPWESVVKVSVYCGAKYTITFKNASGGTYKTFNGYASQTIGEITGDNFPNLQDNGEKVFCGWYTGNGGSGNVVTKDTVINGNLTLYPYYLVTTNNTPAVSNPGDMVYSGYYLAPKIYVYYGNVRLTANVDYKLIYSDNIYVGTASVRVKFLGDYSNNADIVKNYNITPKSLNDCEIDIKDFLCFEDNTAHKYLPYVSYLYKGNNVYLKYLRDYNVVFDNEGTTDAYIKAGNYTATINGCGNYSGSIKYNIIVEKKKNICDASISYGNATHGYNAYYVAEYTGDYIEPSITVKYGKNKLKQDIDYRLIFSRNKNPGRAVITIQGLNEYGGMIDAYFTIKPKKNIGTLSTDSEKGNDMSTYTSNANTKYVYNPSVFAINKTSDMSGDYSTEKYGAVLSNGSFSKRMRNDINVGFGGCVIGLNEIYSILMK